MENGVNPKFGDVVDLSDAFISEWLEKSGAKSKNFVVVAITPIDRYPSNSNIVVQELNKYASDFLENGKILYFSNQSAVHCSAKMVGRANPRILKKLTPGPKTMAAINLITLLLSYVFLFFILVSYSPKPWNWINPVVLTLTLIYTSYRLLRYLSADKK